jgi:hypothetical protein
MAEKSKINLKKPGKTQIFHRSLIEGFRLQTADRQKKKIPLKITFLSIKSRNSSRNFNKKIDFPCTNPILSLEIEWLRMCHQKHKVRFSWGLSAIIELLCPIKLKKQDSVRLDKISDLQGARNPQKFQCHFLFLYENLNFWFKLALNFISGKSVFHHEIAPTYVKNEKKNQSPLRPRPEIQIFK